MWPFLSNEQREEREEQRQRRRLAEELKREARYYARLIPQILADMGFDHWLRKESRPEFIEAVVTGRRARQRIAFVEAKYNQDAIYLRVDTTKLPYRVRLTDLKDTGVLETLSSACERQIAYKTFPDIEPWQGTWFIVYREGAINAIPREFAFKDAITNIPKTSTPLRYCAGVTENMSLIMPDIATMPHLLIAGATGMGKSVHLNSILLQLLWRNGPDRVRFLMIDLKGGMELQDYGEIPHLFRPIVTEIEDVEPALSAFKDEMRRRQNLFAGKCRDLNGWNQLNSKRRLPYLILVIDELAQILKNPNQNLSKEVEIILGSVLNVSRATGGHAILCTQRPSVDVVTGYIKTNVSSRVAFAVPTMSDSRVILDSSDASNLTLPGRAMFLNGAKRVEMQTPKVSQSLIKRTIKTIVSRPGPPDMIEPLTLEEVLSYAVDNGGDLSYRYLFEHFKDRASQASLRDMLQQIDGEIVIVRDEPYLVEKNGRRQLTPVTDDLFVESGPV